MEPLILVVEDDPNILKYLKMTLEFNGCQVEIFPMLEFGWLNGWLLLAIFFGIFGVTVLTSPKEVIARLYENEEWKKRGILLKIYLVLN